MNLDTNRFTVPDFDTRGRHFTRIWGNDPAPQNWIIDIGPLEVQEGQFYVDSLLDESDLQYTSKYCPELDILPTGPACPTGGDFTLREALEFTGKNPENDNIFFGLKGDEAFLLGLDDPVEATAAPTILLKLRSTDVDLSLDSDSALVIGNNVTIQGPVGYELEIDASGIDPTPDIIKEDGARVFLIDDGDVNFNIEVTINNLTLLGGDVQQEGGGIYNKENLTFNKGTLKDNAAQFGGGLFTEIGNLLIENSTLYSNTAKDKGGALYVNTGWLVAITTANVRNTTISGNNAGFSGGGIYNENGVLLVEFSTITLNSASGEGDGIFNSSVQTSVNVPLTELYSTIVSGNMISDIDFSTTGNIESLGYNLIGNGTADVVFNRPGDVIGVLDPMLAPLMNTGGFTATHRPRTEKETGVPSWVIDKGNPLDVAGIGDVPVFDQRQFMFTRVFDGLQDSKDRIDIGAHEIQPSTFYVDTWADENDGNITAGNFSFREAVAVANANPLADTIKFSDAFFPKGPGGEYTISTSLGGLQPGTPVDIRITDSVYIFGLGRQSRFLYEGRSLSFDGSGAFDDQGNKVRLLTIDDGEQVGGDFDIDGVVDGFDFLQWQRGFGTSYDDTDLDDWKTNYDAPPLFVEIYDMTFTNYSDTNDVGGVIKSHEILTIGQSEFADNSTFDRGLEPSTSYHGGALYQRNGSLTLDNVTLTANSTDGVDADGGAIYVRDADLTLLNDSVVTGNSTTQTLGSGGGIYLRNGRLDMSDSTVVRNTAPAGEANGAGLFAREAVLNIVDSTFSRNSMTGSNSEGAGIFSQDSQLYLYNTVMILNSTSGTQSDGAGIYLSGGTALLEQVDIKFNSTTGQASLGAGIAAVNSQLVILDSTIERNTTSGLHASGGGLANLGGEVTVLNSTLSNNSVSGLKSLGGGIFSATDLPVDSTAMILNSTTILNSTISGNSSSYRGGGIYNAAGLTKILHSTITNNSVPYFGNGGGVASYADLDTTRTEVGSSIISGNFSTEDLGNPYSDVDSVAGSLQAIQGKLDLDGDGAIDINGDDDGIFAYIDVIHGKLDLDGDGTIETNGDDDGTVYGIDVIVGELDLDGDGQIETNGDDDGKIRSFVSLGYNLIGLGVASTLNEFDEPGDATGIVDPKLGPLSKVVSSDLTATHALLLGSPAINKGDFNFDPNDFSPALTTDQRGTVRELDGQIDVGAVESETADFDQNRLVDGKDFLAWQRGFGTATGAEKGEGDADNDRDVDANDLILWQFSFGDTPPLSALASSHAASSGAWVASRVAEEVSAEGVTAEGVSAQRLVTGLSLAGSQTLSSSMTVPDGSKQISVVELAARDEVIGRLSAEPVSRRMSAGDDDSEELELLGSLSEEASAEEPFLAEDLVFEQIGRGEF